jgi:hypothetical protein
MNVHEWLEVAAYFISLAQPWESAESNWTEAVNQFINYCFQHNLDIPQAAMV